MVVHSKNEALMCKVFPSSLGPVVMRWFDGLKECPINSFQELTRAFGARFVTCNRVPHPLDSLLSMTMRKGETLKAYSDRSRVEVRPALRFSDEDKVGTLQPHDDALVVTLKIGGYDVKRVSVDQGSGAEIMYHDLYKGLKLRPEHLACYDCPLVGFDGKAIILKGQIRLLVQGGLEVVEVDFIVVDAYSPYTAIMARPWFHAMGVVSSTLHLKVKYPLGDQVEELIESQSMTRECLVPVIRHQSGGESSAYAE
ncbi:uncharacterized protein LOC142639947 [Castanea sativa]|uniref:uncharacterized protein LOC142639947 n=1 Tax=Castanea sativa TaxID=21020 RepID=UPI003F64B75D